MNRTHLKKINVIILLLAFSLINFTCQFGNDPEDVIEFGLYRLADESITWKQFQNISNKDSLLLKEWITPSMIENYEFSSHILTLNIDAFANAGKWSGVIFAAVAGGKRCYYGHALTDPIGWRVVYPANDMIWLMNSNYYCANDPRNDEMIKKALKSSGKYRGGIKVTIDNISASTKNDSALFTYSFTIQNVDENDLYVVDPGDDVTGWSMSGCTSLFIFEKNRTYPDYIHYRLEPRSTKTNPRLITEKNLRPENLLFLKKGAYEKRTYTQRLSLSRELPYGNYHAIMQYVNLLGAPTSNCTISGGRVLNGYVSSNILDITYSKEKGIVINNKDVVLE